VVSLYIALASQEQPAAIWAMKPGLTAWNLFDVDELAAVVHCIL
jgi:hypothetical protein